MPMKPWPAAAATLLAACLEFGNSDAVADEASCTGIDQGRCFLDLPTGVRMAYVETGPANGPVVLFLHGLTDSIRSWTSTVTALHEMAPDLRIYAVDLRGHGKTSRPPDRCAPSP